MTKSLKGFQRSADNQRSSGRIFHVISFVIGFFFCKTIDKAGEIHQILDLGNLELHKDQNYDAPQTKSSTTKPSKSKSSKSKSSRNKSRFPLSELTNNPPPNSLKCPPKTMPIYDRLVPATDSSEKRKIPKTLHISYKSRCVPTDIFADSIQRWMEALPDYSFYFHDDHAVDRLLQQDWPEFPGLHRTMQCMKYKGAMTIDLWRMLIIYEFGGLYTDIDNAPIPEFKNGSVISPEDTFFASSDAWNRPIQNIFAMEARHPIAEFTVQNILINVYNLESLRYPRLVFTTGPEALKKAYLTYLKITYGDEGRKILLKPGVYHGFLKKQIHKEEKWHWLHPQHNETVEIDGENVTRQEIAHAISGVDHWLNAQDENEERFDYSCREYLYRLEHGHRIEGNWTVAKSEWLELLENTIV